MLRRLVAVPIVFGVLVSGCHGPVGGALAGQATDQWQRTYSLPSGGEIQITNTNGAIEVEGYEGTAVEVQAERIARAMTDDAAREMLTRIAIEEDVAPDHVSIRTEGIRGILVGVSFEVRYRVRAPHSTVVRLRTTNGRVAVKAFRGRVFATSTNGGIIGEALGGSVEARATNGNARIAMTGIGSEGVKVRTTNGRVDLTVPESVKADLSASCRNGAIEITDVTFKPEGEQTRRQVRGTLNGGGPLIELSTVNGGIRIRAAGTSGASEL